MKKGRDKWDNRSKSWSLFLILLSLPAVTLSCVSKEVAVTETYYETEYKTEYKTESYTEIGNERRDFLKTKMIWSDKRPFTKLEWAKQLASSYYNVYEISTAKNAKSQIKLALISEPIPWAIQVVDLAGITPLLPPPAYRSRSWFDNFNAIVADPKRLLVFARSDQHPAGQDIAIDVTGVEEFIIITTAPEGVGIPVGPIVKSVQLIWSDEVTKERQVPYQVPVQVKKQRTVMKTVKVPFWQTQPAAQTPPLPTPPAIEEPSTPQPHAPSGTLSFEAAEYTNAEYGFSIKYPKDWQKFTSLITGAVPLFGVGVPTFPVGTPTLIVEVAEGVTFKDALTAAIRKISAGTDQNPAINETATALPDGIKGWQAVVEGVARPTDMKVKSFCVGTSLGNTSWVIAMVATITEKAPYDEALFSEIAHTLRVNVTPPAIPSDGLMYEDDFSNPDSGFTRADIPDFKASYKDGEYHILVKKPNWSVWQYNFLKGPFTDFVLEADAKLVSGPYQTTYGVAFRMKDNDNFYRFLISADGNYLMGARLDGTWTELQRWTRSEYVEKGNSTNHLKMVCKGSQIEVYVNGHYLTAVTDSSFDSGYIGVILDASAGNTQVAFDNIKVYSPD